VLSAFVQRVLGTATRVAGRFAAVVRAATRPRPMVVALLLDVKRSREELVAENALLRQQLIIAARSSQRPEFATYERGVLVLLARLVPRWREAMLLVKPETILRWHRDGFGLLWRWRSQSKSGSQSSLRIRLPSFDAWQQRTGFGGQNAFEASS
jgi:hypothetical protein